MKNLEIFHKIFGLILIIIGIVSYVLPVPGSTFLIVLGLIWFIGRNKTLHLLKRLKKGLKF